MENANTYRAIITGTIMLFAGCLIWLLISRQTISSLNSELDTEKLRNESLLSEKLLTEKELDKKSKQAETMSKRIDGLNGTLKNKSEIISSQAFEKRKIKKALQLAREQQQSDKALSDKLRSDLALQRSQYFGLQNKMRLQGDSIHLLQNAVAALEQQLDDAITRSIDQTLILAERRNNKPTSKARRADELVANVELPAKLSNLSFIVEGPDGAILSTGGGSVTVRQIGSQEMVTASLRDAPIAPHRMKKMEIVYKPKGKLDPGIYTFKIRNGSDYVGSMQVSLR